MSGEIVALPLAVPFIGLVLTGGVLVGAGLGVARSVQAIVDKQVEAAARAAEVEKARLREWQVFQAAQRRQMEEQSALQATLRQAEAQLTAMQLLSPVEARAGHPESGDGPTDRGYVSLGLPKQAARHDIGLRLEELNAVWSNLPEGFKQDASSPYQLLEKQRLHLLRQRDSHQPPTLPELQIFQSTITRTLNGYLLNLEATQKSRAELTRRLEALLDEVLVYSQLPAAATYTADLLALRQQLVSRISTKMVQHGHLDILQSRWDNLKQAIDQDFTQSTYRTGLTQSMTQHLQAMGYAVLEPFVAPESKETTTAVLAIPGGERVTIALLPDNRLAFELAHESGGADGRELTAAELARFRQQEERWCGDFHELIRRLAQEGFQYNIKLERDIPEASIPIVVVETADDILTAEFEEDEEMERFQENSRHRRME